MSGRLAVVVVALFTILTVAAVSSRAETVSCNAVQSSVAVNANPCDVVVARDGSYAYVANFDSDNLSVIDLQTFMKVTDIPVGDGPSSLVVASDDSFLSVANFFSDDVWFINLQTDMVDARVDAGDGPELLPFRRTTAASMSQT